MTDKPYGTRRVTIRPDQDEWLNNHPEINVSGLMQVAIDDMKARYEIKLED